MGDSGVRSGEAPRLSGGSEQPASQLLRVEIDAEDSSSTLNLPLSSKNHKDRGEPDALRGWPLKPERLNGSIVSQRLNTLGDVALLIFPALSLGKTLYIFFSRSH